MIRLIVIASALLLASCASSGPKYYQASAEGKAGYHETKLAEDRYRIAYVADANEKTMAGDLALLRAAELTMQKGHAWFEIAARSAEVTEESRITPVAQAGISHATTTNCGLLGCSSTTRPVHTTSFGTEVHTLRDKAVANVEFVMGNGTMPSGASYYEARSLAETLRSRYLN